MHGEGRLKVEGDGGLTGDGWRVGHTGTLSPSFLLNIMSTTYLVDGDGYELRLLVLVKQREVDAFVDVYNLKGTKGEVVTDEEE